ncbi:hypothetical protein GMD78_12130 [Ornithinibacillus sp. L9]|uniref:Uncharacterized protein n=1 Tax=Ornithinibacillus caprae TaxID=2678566 RepID=A0A6N8FHH8_9BACI|nr:hypothetical protein [Ornithinibacillus caprae]MUK89122.1 hypothetical protein [Ornithinibacillus caprae]
MNSERFLPNDIAEATKHQRCYEECRELADVHYKHGNFAMAMHRMTDAQKSLNELSKLADKKICIDRHNAIVQSLNAAGIPVQIIRRVHHDQ